MINHAACAKRHLDADYGLRIRITADCRRGLLPGFPGFGRASRRWFSAADRTPAFSEPPALWGTTAAAYSFSSTNLRSACGCICY